VSYILDALADSEQARQQLTAAPMYSLLPAVGEDAPRQRFWPYAVALGLTLNAAAALFWLRPAPAGDVASGKVSAAPRTVQLAAAAPEVRVAAPARSEPPVASEPADTHPARSEPTATRAAERAVLETRLPPRAQHIDNRRGRRAPAPLAAAGGRLSANPAKLAALAEVPKPAAKTVAAPEREAGPDAAAKVKPVRSPAPVPVVPAITKLAADSGAAAAANSTPATVTESRPANTPIEAEAKQPVSSQAAQARPTGVATELPPAMLQQLPALSIAGFIRDADSSSMVIVNDRLAREGDTVAPGVKLEKILDNHLVFSYMGYRFKR
jgi:general secretion pathway protein B